MPIPNVVRYSTSPLTGVLRKGNFYLGAADQDYGPSNVTGYYNGVTSSTYTVYVWDGSEIRYNLPTSDSDLSSFLSNRAGVNFSGLTESLLWSVTQSDILVSNKTYENVITNSLVINYDASFLSSYPRSGTRWYNITGTSSGLLTNGPSFSFTNIFFDGVDDHIDLGTVSAIDFTSGLTIEAVVNFTSLGAGGWERFVELNDGSSGTSITFGRNSVFQTFLFQCRNITGGDLQRRFVSSANHLVVGQTAMFTTTLPAGTPGNPTSGCKLYKNGVEVAGAEQVTGEFPRLPSTVNRNTCYIGRSPFVGNSFFNGSYFSLRVYNRTLSATEIRQNYLGNLAKFIGQGILTNNLIYYYDAGFNGSFVTSSNTWFDVSGNEVNGTLVNGPTFSSAAGGAIRFDGTNDQITISATPSLTNQVTLECWVQFNNVSTVNAPDYGFGFVAGRENAYRLLCNNTGIGWVCATTNNSWYSAGTEVGYYTTFATASWWHMVGTYDGSNNKIYVNGVLRTTGSAISGNILSGTQPFKIGYPSNLTPGVNTIKALNGQVAESRMYNRALTDAEILSNYNNDRVRFGL